MEPSQSATCGDDSFGPAVNSTSCRGGLDFTVAFEESILSILPTALFIGFVPFQALILLRRQIRIKRNALYTQKQIAIGLYTVLQLVLVVTTARARHRSSLAIASASLSLILGFALAFLSHLEHVKSIRPSFLISFFLIVTILFDIARTRTHWLGRDEVVAGALTASLVMKCVILSLEAIQKRSLLGLHNIRSAESTSGFISRSIFSWLNPLLRTGYNQVLDLDDLPAIHEKLDSEKLGNRLQVQWDKCNQKRKHALTYACVWSLRWEVLAIALPKFCFVGFNISQTYLIKNAVHYVQGANEESSPTNHGYGLIGAFALVYFGLAIATGWYKHLTFRLMSMMRGELTAVVYTKLLALTKADESAALTLMGTDIQRIAQTFYMALVDVIPAAVQLCIAIYLLYRELGVVCIAPVIVALVGTVLSTALTGVVTPRQTAWLEAVQRRINYTSDILGSIRNIKTLGLSTQMCTEVQSLRNSEMEISKKYRVVQALSVTLMNLPSTFNVMCVFAAYAIVAKVQGTEGLSVSQAMASLTLLNLIAMPLSQLLFSIPQGWAAMGCFTRIQDFLLQETLSDDRAVSFGPSTGSDRRNSSPADDVELMSLRATSKKPVVEVSNGNFGWGESNFDVIKDLNISISQQCKLTLVVGPVGCGKSTLLRALLGETAKSQGLVSLATNRIAYCDQTPWLMNGTIRENILTGADHDEVWYNTVIRACVLDIDMRQWPEADLTIIGSKGIKLSGGQKQRISLARALYSRHKLVVCDDVLSGLDSVTEEVVFKRVFGSSGLFRQNGSTVILATHSVKRLPQADSILALGQHGEVVGHGTFEELSFPASYAHEIEGLAKVSSNEQSEQDPDKLLSEYNKRKAEKEAIDESRKVGDWATYKFYFRSLGWMRFLLFLFFVSVNALFQGLQHVWINWWASSNDRGEPPRLGYWLGIFTFMCSTQGLSMGLAIGLLWIYINPRAGKNLHQSMIGAVARAPLSYFTAIDTGVLVNRFSQDLRLADMAIPGALINMAFQLASCLVTIALAVTAVGWFALVLPPVLIALYFIQRFYLRTSRQLRLLEIEANAPLTSHFIESLNGLVTIRAFGWVESFAVTNKRLLDLSQRPYYLLLCIQNWLVLVLDIIVACLAVVLMGMAVALRAKLSAGFLGLALVNMMGLSHSLTSLVQFWTQFETSIGAIARIKNFSEKTPDEALPGEDENPDRSWPTEGSLRFDGVSATYDNGATSVLNGVSFSVEKGQKVGIVGRTGSGKSSMTLGLLRMIDVTSGTISIDGVDLSTVRGSVVRERLSCLTQEPLLFPESVRFNVDPWGKCTDEAIIASLQKLDIWKVIQAKASNKTDDSSVLDTIMDREFLSHGQRQLFCLARAILKPGKVLILDEPTSSVDSETDAKMQKIIRTEFSSHTIIMIAHRLSSLLDFDRVLVLDGGRVVEFGQPAELLKDKSGAFSKLYHGSL